MEASNQ